MHVIKVRKFISILLALIVILTSVNFDMFNMQTQAEDDHKVILTQINYGRNAKQLWDGVTYTRSYSKAKIYPLGISDITKYLETDEISSKDLMKMVFDVDSNAPDENIWLRSTPSNSSTSAFVISGSKGTIETLDVTSTASVRLVFKINLSGYGVGYSGTMPNKGDIISLNIMDDSYSDERVTDKFRVLNISGSTAELLCMRSFNPQAQIFNSSSSTYNAVVSTPDGDVAKDIQKYDFSKLYYYITSSLIYNLDSNVRDAMSSNYVYQDNYYVKAEDIRFTDEDIEEPEEPDDPDDPDEPGEEEEEEQEDTHERIHREISIQKNYSKDKRYAWDGVEHIQIENQPFYYLGINDITEYLGTDNIKSKDLMKMFFDVDSGTVNEKIWLRSVCLNHTEVSWFVDGNNATIDRTYNSYELSQRIAFTIDISASCVNYSGSTPTKGMIINLNIFGDGNQPYRVLKVNGNAVELLSMFSLGEGGQSVSYNPYRNRTYSVSSPDGEKDVPYQEYHCSAADSLWEKMNYSEIMNAIIPQQIEQDNYFWLYNNVPFIKDEVDDDTTGEGNYIDFSSDSSFSIFYNFCGDGKYEYSTDAVHWQKGKNNSWNLSLNYYKKDNDLAILSAQGSDGRYHIYIRGIGNTTLGSLAYNVSSSYNDKFEYMPDYIYNDDSRINELFKLSELAEASFRWEGFSDGRQYEQENSYGCWYDDNKNGLITTYFSHFYLGGKNIKCDGDIMSLLDYRKMGDTQMSAFAFARLFHHEKELISIPSFTTESLGNYACYYSFVGCTGLKSLPELPATQIGIGCYDTMFGDCTSLEKVQDVLPAIEVPDYAYRSMYSDIPIVTAPQMEPYYVGKCGMDSMFKNTKLPAPCELPAKVLNNFCYNSIFEGCPFEMSIKRDKEHQIAWSLPDDSYGYHYGGRNKKRENQPTQFIGTMFGEDPNADGLGYHEPTNLFYGEPQIGKTYYASGKASLYFSSAIPFSLGFDKINWDGVIEYSNNGADWIPFTTEDEMVDAAYDEGTYFIYVRGHDNSTLNKSRFKLFGEGVTCEGDLYNLLEYRKQHIGYDKVGDYTFAELFMNCKGLVEGPEYSYCLKKGTFLNTFKGCTSLTKSISYSGHILNNEVPESCYEGMYEGCSKLEPEFNIYYSSSHTFGKACFKNMFKCCDNIMQVGNIVAYNASESCFEGMFMDCKNIHTFDGINIVNYAPKCCKNMFNGCEQMITIEDNAFFDNNRIMSDNCYEGMFANCTALVAPAKLRATTLAPGCFKNMYKGCTSLVDFPEFNIDELKDNCYEGMFEDCTSLTTLPELNSTKLAKDCYASMFKNCTGIRVSDELNSEYSIPWKLPNEAVGDNYDPNMIADTGGIFFGDPVKGVTYYLYCKQAFVEFSSPSLFSVGFNKKAWDGTIEYSTDLKTWYKYTTVNFMVNAVMDEDLYHIYFRGSNNTTLSINENSYTQFKMAGNNVSCNGNIMELLDYENIASEINSPYAFANLFKDMQGLVKAPNLSATTLSNNCYYGMFENCSSLTVTPNLPATILSTSCYKKMFEGCVHLNEITPFDAESLANNCYNSMFKNCASLQSTCEFPIEELVDGCYSHMFDGCSNLYNIQNLNSINLARRCYEGMFANCTGLYSTPTLPAYSMAEECYKGMFEGCTSLTTSARLDSSDLANSCYKEMFKDCTGINAAHNLTASVLKESCYEGMFSGCKNMSSVPVITASQLDKASCKNMFMDCTSITAVTSIPANSMAEACFEGMYKGCTNLKATPTLNSSDLAQDCYKGMFEDCTSLNCIIDLPADTLAAGCYKAMFRNCTTLSRLPYLNATLLVDECYSNMFDGCTSIKVSKVKTLEYAQPWLIPQEAVGDYGSSMFRGTTGPFKGDPIIGVTYYVPLSCIDFSSEEFFTVNLSNITWDGQLQYSTDGDNWNDYTSTYTTVYAEERLDGKYHAYFRGINTYLSRNMYQYSQFILGGNDISCDGNIMTLLNYTSPSNAVEMPYAFYLLFANQTNLVSAPQLTATTLSERCYYSMFSGCSGLKNSPVLPAKIGTKECYGAMFLGCTGLEIVGDISLEETGDYSCVSMFEGCSNLEDAPNLKVTKLGENCYDSMFKECVNLVNAPKLLATQLAQSCYKNMFENCRSLQIAPSLPANELANSCYQAMFAGCTKLTKAPKLSSTELANYCYSNMFYGCNSLVDIPSLPANVVPNYAYMNMFNGCKSIITLPRLNATVLNEGCYQSMFDGCTGIKVSSERTDEYVIPWELPSDAIGTFYDEEMLNGTSGPFSGAPLIGHTYYLPGSVGLEFVSEHPFKVGFSSIAWNGKIRYSIDSDVWYEYKEVNKMVPASYSDNLYHIYFQGENNDYMSTSTSIYSNFVFEGNDIICRGDIKELLDKQANNSIILNEYQYANLFKDAKEIIAAPTLSANTLSPNCYDSMFEGCTSLAEAPNLPAIYLAEGCYSNMFNGCTSMSETPELPATILEPKCYQNMFEGCIKIQTPPQLLANEMKTRCYYGMFKNCKGLENVPELPSTSLADECYRYMFSGCTAIKNIPNLPASDLAEKCYAAMFYDCTSLKTVPNLPATKLEYSSYSNMFSGCKGIRISEEKTEEYGIPWELPMDAEGNDYSDAMFSRTSGPFTDGALVGKTYYLYGYPGLEFKSEEPFKVGFSSIAWNGSIEYSTDVNDWAEYNTVNTMISAAMGEDNLYHIFFRGNNNDYMSSSISKYSTFKFEGNNIISNGNVMQLLDYDDIPTEINKNYAFAYLFRNVHGLTTAPSLPATMLSDNCYYNMFANCIDLAETPKLPAQIMMFNCYNSMFSGCKSLTKTPKLESTLLEDNCYTSMFSNCTSLVDVTDLPADELKESCYANMFSGCTSLVNAPKLSATSLAEQCYFQMFYGCSSIKDIPKLPADEVPKQAYYAMFGNCSSITTIPKLTATTLYDSCYQSMFADCTGLKISDEKTSEYSIPWELPENALAESGFSSTMFRGTSGPFVGAPIVGKTYYLPGKLGLEFSSDDEFSLAFSSMAWDGEIEYSVDEVNWESYSTAHYEIKAKAVDDKYHIYIRGVNNTTLATSSKNYTRIALEGNNISCDGNIMILLDGQNVSDNITTNYTFAHLFENNPNLISAPSLPAETMTSNCYDGMFSNCTGLKQAPSLPAMVLDNACYQNMFKGCSSLESAPKLPANDLETLCYNGMFSDCTSLTSIPELLSNKMATSCYQNMFSGCSGLVETPELSATILAKNCYSKMFENCSSLTKLPKLNSKILEDNCYLEMFKGCENIKVSDVKTSEYQIPWKLPSDATGKDFDYSMIENTTGPFTNDPEIGKTYYLYGSVGLDFNCESEFSIAISHITWDGEIEYSADAVNWLPYNSPSKLISSLTGDDGLEHIYIRGINNTTLATNKDLNNSATFVLIGNDIIADGNIMTLLDYENPSDTIDKNYAFANLFNGCSDLISGPELTATNLSAYCYYNMFNGCDNLATHPVINAQKVKDYSMAYMFNNCKKLENTISFDIEELANGCYQAMYKGCISLRKLPKLKAITLATNCYNSLFENCTGIKVSESKTSEYAIPWRLPDSATGEDFDPNMLKGTSGPYTGAPNLRQTYYLYGTTGILLSSPNEFKAGFKSMAWDNRLEYSLDGINWEEYTESTGMITSEYSGGAFQINFRGIGNTTLAKNLARYTQFDISGTKIKVEGDISTLLDYDAELDTVNTEWTFANLFRDCKSIISLPNMNLINLSKGCYAYMFSGCNSLKELPELPSTHLADSCYKSMFSGCKSLVISEQRLSEKSKEWILPNASTTNLTDWNTGMIKNTSGPFTNNPIVNKKYYYEYPDNDYQMFDPATGRAIGISEEGCAIDENGNPKYINRLAFALDLKDVYDYYGKRVITTQELDYLYNGIDAENNSIIRMCSANTNMAINTWISTSSHCFDVENIVANRMTRPAFRVDLTKLTNDTKTLNCVKGDVIYLDVIKGANKKLPFRVLKVEDKVALILSMTDIATSEFNTTSKLTNFSDGGMYQQYENSNLDTYINETFVNTKLTDKARGALVESKMLQYAYSLDIGDDIVTNAIKVRFDAGEGGKSADIFVDISNPHISDEQTRHLPVKAPEDKIITFWSKDDFNSNQTRHIFDDESIADGDIFYAVYGSFKFVDEVLYSSASKDSSSDKLMKTKMDVQYTTDMRPDILEEFEWIVQKTEDNGETYEDDDSQEIANAIYEKDTQKLFLEGFSTGKRSLLVKYEDIEIARVPIHILFNDTTTRTETDTFKSIYWASENSMVLGYDNGTKFKPTDTATRQNFAVILWRHAGKPRPKSSKMTFPDCTCYAKTSDTYNAILWASENRIVLGYQQTGKPSVYKPTRKISRIEMAIMLYRYAGYCGLSKSVSNSAKPYKDTKGFPKSSDRYKSTLWVSDHGVAKGYEDGNYGVNDPLQRQQLVIMLYRFDKLTHE